MAAAILNELGVHPPERPKPDKPMRMPRRGTTCTYGNDLLALVEYSKGFVWSDKARQKPGLLAKVQGLKKDGKPDHDARVELLLENADEGIGDKLIAFEKEQAAGEKLNEVSVKYFKKHPRDFDDAWPQLESDKALRHFMTTMIEASPDDIKKEAKKQLGLELD